jgi:hypothetical protein
LLGIDGVLASHSGIAANLATPGPWAGEDARHPSTPEEFRLVEPYLGVFECIFNAYIAGQLDAEMIGDLYGYRLSNIWANRKIVTGKLQHPGNV